MTTVCLMPQGTLSYPDGGGYLWIYLNWALGLRSAGCRVIWLESIGPRVTEQKARANIEILEKRLTDYGLQGSLALCTTSGEPMAFERTSGCLPLEAALEADLLINQRYGAPEHLVSRFRRTALLDIDPGLLQVWISRDWVKVAPHDCYFTIGEGVGKNESSSRVGEIEWLHTAPCVALDEWPVSTSAAEAFTTLAHWYASGGTDDTHGVNDDKRTGFLPYIELPSLCRGTCELALDAAATDPAERSRWESHGWRVVNSYDVASTPAAFREYVARSLGEFSCAKPSYVRLGNAWLSDRTVCYLASGRPAVVQHTGHSAYLPDDCGIFRFHNVTEAASHIDRVLSDYDEQARQARKLAEEYFDARKVCDRVISTALA